MKVHDEIESLTDVYLAGGLEMNERLAVEAHEAACEKCAAILTDAREFHGWVKGSSAGGAPPTGLEDRIIANLRVRTHRRGPWAIRLLAGVAAVFVIVIVGAVFSESRESVGMLQRMTVAHQNPEFEFATTDPTPEAKAGRFSSRFEDDQFAGDSRGDLSRGKSFQDTKKEALKDTMGLDKNLVSGYTAVGGGSGGGGRHGGKPGFREVERKVADAARAPSTLPAKPAELSDHSESAGEALEKEKRSAEGEEAQPAPNPTEPQDPAAANRKIIRNADLHLEVEAYDKAYAKIGEITKSKRGFVAGASTTRLANGKIRATVTLRIPPEKFEETLAELGALGTVRHQAISTSDVTKQYMDLESRLKSKETLVERLKKVLMEGKGTVKELMEVEVQMGATIEQIEAIKGELKYYDNLVGLSTITMQVFEKDLGLPFEYVQTLQSNIGVTANNADAAYEAAQKVVLDAGGQVAESRMTRANDDQASGFVRGKVDADKFPEVRESLKKLGHVDQDTVNQQQTGRGGQGDAKPGAPVKKEQAVVDFTVNTPPRVVTKQAKLGLEAKNAAEVYQTARREIEAAGGEINGGSLTDRIDGAKAFVRGQVDAEKFPALVEKLKSLGVVKSATVEQIVQGGAESARPPLYRERGEILLDLASPPPLIPEESGVGRVLRDTFTRSFAGVLWSFEKLIVGIALAGPWIVLAGLVVLVWRRAKRRKAEQPAA